MRKSANRVTRTDYEDLYRACRVLHWARGVLSSTDHHTDQYIQQAEDMKDRAESIIKAYKLYAPDFLDCVERSFYSGKYGTDDYLTGQWLIKYNLDNETINRIHHLTSFACHPYPIPF